MQVVQELITSSTCDVHTDMPSEEEELLTAAQDDNDPHSSCTPSSNVKDASVQTVNFVVSDIC